jgi:hypothetical protein
VNSSFSRQRFRCMCVALAATAFAAPVAHARHAPGEDGKTSPPLASVWTASSLETDRLGPKHVPVQHPVSRPPTNVVRVVRPAGFDWADAGIGAGVASLTLALVAGVAMLVTRRSRRTIVPDRSELAGA